MSKKDPEDGVTVINIYSKAETELGKLLSNFTPQRLELDEGVFGSIEAYWYYLLIDPKNPDREAIRDKFGYDAKSYGDDCLKANPEYEADIPDFEEKIKKALTIKVKNNVRIQFLMKASSLPFDHYYWYGKKQTLSQYKWIVEHFEDLRRLIKTGKL